MTLTYGRDDHEYPKPTSICDKLVDRDDTSDAVKRCKNDAGRRAWVISAVVIYYMSHVRREDFNSGTD